MRRFGWLFFFALAFFGMTSAARADGALVYSAPGTYDVVVPDGVSAVAIETDGGGGGGGASCDGTQAGSGGAGGYNTGTYGVTPGDMLTVTIGEGGPGGCGGGGGGGGGAAWVEGNGFYIGAGGGGGGDGTGGGCDYCGGDGGAGTAFITWL